MHGDMFYSASLVCVELEDNFHPWCHFLMLCFFVGGLVFDFYGFIIQSMDYANEQGKERSKLDGVFLEINRIQKKLRIYSFMGLNLTHYQLFQKIQYELTCRKFRNYNFNKLIGKWNPSKTPTTKTIKTKR